MPANAAFRSSASAWACNVRSSSLPATWSASTDANSTEFDPQSPHPVVCLLDEQYSITDKGGTMRLGSYPTQAGRGQPGPSSLRQPLVHERHRHRYEFNNQYRQQFAAHGLLVTGTSPGRRAGGGDGIAGPPVVCGGAVPPGIQVQTDPCPPAVSRIRGGGPEAARSEKGGGLRMRSVVAAS